MSLSISWGMYFIQSFNMSLTDSGMFCSYGLSPKPRSFTTNAAIFERMSSSLWSRKYWVKADGPDFSDRSRVSQSDMSSVDFLSNSSSELDQIKPRLGWKRS